jgi:hypothetical protein
MARIKSRVRRFFSLLVPLLFISAVHAEQTPYPQKPSPLKRRMKSSPLSIPINISPGKPRLSNQPVKMRWQKILVW